MRYKRNIKIILGITFIMSLTAFVIDLRDYSPGIMQNIFDIILMTGIFFGIGMILYGLMVLLMRISPKQS